MILTLNGFKTPKNTSVHKWRTSLGHAFAYGTFGSGFESAMYHIFLFEFILYYYNQAVRFESKPSSKLGIFSTPIVFLSQFEAKNGLMTFRHYNSLVSIMTKIGTGNDKTEYITGNTFGRRACNQLWKKCFFRIFEILQLS